MNYYTIAFNGACLDSKHCFPPLTKAIPKSALRLSHIDIYKEETDRAFLLVMTRRGQFYADCITGTLYSTETGQCLSGAQQNLILSDSQILPFVAAPANKRLKRTKVVTGPPAMADKTGSVSPALRQSRGKYIRKSDPFIQKEGVK